VGTFQWFNATKLMVQKDAGRGDFIQSLLCQPICSSGAPHFPPPATSCFRLRAVGPALRCAVHTPLINLQRLLWHRQLNVTWFDSFDLYFSSSFELFRITNPTIEENIFSAGFVARSGIFPCTTFILSDVLRKTETK